MAGLRAHRKALLADLHATSPSSSIPRQASTVLLGTFLVLLLTGADGYREKTTVPDFSGTWWRDSIRDFYPVPERGPSPLFNTYFEINDQVPVGNYDSPILKPWAAEIIKEAGDIRIAGGLAPDPHTQCSPMGVPYVLQARENVRFLQTPNWIMITYENDDQRRLVHLNARQPTNPAPTRMGHSVGHYEGDTLVIDTVGIARHGFSVIDRFGTPHTEALRVIERYRVGDDRNSLRVEFAVEDPGTFTMPWYGAQIYHKGTTYPFEHVCAQNNREANIGGVVGDRRITIPEATTLDF